MSEQTKKLLGVLKPLQFHQGDKTADPLLKTSPSSSKLLILSTPVKPNKDNCGADQRTVPLCMNNEQLMITAGNKSIMIPLKRSHEAPPLALPIVQLNKQSPTFVKNEVGQVLGQLIPLGKFSNINQNLSSPVTTVSSPTAVQSSKSHSLKPISPTVRTIEMKNINSEVNQRSKSHKLAKSDNNNTSSDNPWTIADVSVDTEKSKVIPVPGDPDSNTQLKNDKVFVVSTCPKTKRANDSVITITGNKPKKQVRLVIKGDKNIASIGRSGTNIKLIPLKQWKLDTKSNVLQPMTESNIPQSKDDDVCKSMAGEKTAQTESYFERRQFNCTFVKEQFDIDDIFEKDPLHIEALSTEEAEMPVSPEERNLLNSSIDECKILEFAKESLNKFDTGNSRRTLSEWGDLCNSEVGSLINDDENTGLTPRERENQKYKQQPNILLPDACMKLKSSNMPDETPVHSNSNIESSTTSVAGNTVEQRIAIRDRDLYSRFGIQKSKISPNERAMLACIRSLKKKLWRSRNNTSKSPGSLELREYQRIKCLPSIQKQFIEVQLRNYGQTSRKARFTKSDIIMARKVLKVTGARGYSNLRKLFSLPGISVIMKAFAKT